MSDEGLGDVDGEPVYEVSEEIHKVFGNGKRRSATAYPPR
jgi:hypothetical protein